MKPISNNIEEIRKKKGYSQEQMAEMTNLNIRTIQRIENGETIPRGDSLQRIASALNTTTDELIIWQQKVDKSILHILNVSQLAVIAYPIMGMILPLILWFSQKDKFDFVDKLGRAILNFQITWFILLALYYSSIVVPKLFSLTPIGFSYSIKWIFISFYCVNIFFILLNGVKIYSYNNYYFPGIRFLK